MKRYEINKMSRNFGSAAAWYNHDAIAEVEAVNPTHYCNGNKPAAYFVSFVEEVYNPMRDFNPCYFETVSNAGPFATEESAKAYAEVHC